MFYRAKRALHRAWFDLRCRKIFETPALPPSDSPLTVLSMLCHGEVSKYLLAVKSFVRFLGCSPHLVVLNDGSLTADDLKTLAHHLPALRVVPIQSISTGICPKGGCWERLLLASELAQHGYVIQLDSDTLTQASLPEVLACVDANRSFTLLGNNSFPEVEPMLEACARLQGNNPMVQAVCERHFDRVPEAASLKYLRGNAGFVGYAPGSIPADRIQWFSDRMRLIAEGTWDTWGSEQLASNLLIANSEDPLPLPSPRYVSYWRNPGVEYARSAFIHFIGPHRYTGGFYIERARRIIQLLMQT